MPVPTGTIASTKYLFSAIDATNQSLNGVATSYSSSASATGGIVGRTLADRELLSKIKYCAPGTYLAAGNNDCQNCGAGYYCEGGNHRAACVVSTCPGQNHTYDEMPKFEITLTGTEWFEFKMAASGNFTIDWGDGSPIENITNTDATNKFYWHVYASVGNYTITLSGRATGYNNPFDMEPGEYGDGLIPTIAFDGMLTGDQFFCNAAMTAINGDLGKIFPIISPSQSPIFFGTFGSCLGLSSIPENLFAGLKGAPVPYMFAITFIECIGLTLIPAGLFAGISGPPADNMFHGTFAYCMGLTGSIPENLFAGISGAPAASMFSDTFSNCGGLTSIPAGLFSGISGAPAGGMFSDTFSNCGGLTSIPAGLFSGISGAPANSMFSYTFNGCSGLTSIPAGLFGNISGAPASSMFYRTFYNCTKLTGPSAKSGSQYLYNLFSTATSAHVGGCYYGATGLSDYASIPAAWK